MLNQMSAKDREGWVEDFLKASFDFREQFIEEWQEAKLGYMNYVEAREDWRSNIRFAYEYSQVETAKSAIVQAIMSQDPRIQFKPLGAEFADKAEVVERVMDHLLWDRARLGTHLEDGVHSMLMYGPMVAKVGWGRRMASMPKSTTIRMGEQEVALPDGEQLVMVEGPTIDIVKVWDYFPDRYGDDEDSQAAIGHRVWVTDEHLRRMAKRGIYKKDVVNDVLNWWRQGGGAEHTSAGGDAGEDVDATLGRSKSSVGETEHPTVRRIPLIEVWTDEDVVTVADKGDFDLHELRCKPNTLPHRRKPFVVEHYVRFKNDPVGLGAVRFIKPVADAIASFHNQANDSRRLLIDSRYLVRDGVPLLDDDLMGGPGSVTYVPNPKGDIESFPPAGEVRLAGDEERSLLEWGDRVGAQSDFTRGVMMPGTGATATEATEVSNRANARTGLIVRRASRFVERIAEKALATAQMFMTKDAVVRTIGSRGYEWTTVSPERLRGVFFAECRGALDNSRAQERERWLALAPAAMQDPYVNPYEFRKRLFMHLGVIDTHTLLLDPRRNAEIPQSVENEMLLDGVDMEVRPTDDHEAHIMALRAIRQVAILPDGSVDQRLQDPRVQAAIRRHEMEHMSALVQQQQGGGPPGLPMQGGGMPGQQNLANPAYQGANAGQTGFGAREAANGTPGGQNLRPPGPMPAQR